MLQAESQKSEYPSPPPQTVRIKGRNGFEIVSLPQLNQYYTNLYMPSKEYAYIKPAFIDFPLNDSLVKTIGEELHFGIRFVARYAGTPYGYPESKEVLKTKEATYITMTPGQVLSTPVQAAVSFKVNLKNENIKTVEQVAGLIRRQLAHMTIFGAVQVSSAEQALIANVFEFLSDFQYDGASQKYQMIFTKRRYIGGTKYIAPQELTIFIEGSHKGRAGQLCAQIFGGKVTEFGWQSEYTLPQYTSMTTVLYAPLPTTDGEGTVTEYTAEQVDLVALPNYFERLLKMGFQAAAVNPTQIALQNLFKDNDYIVMNSINSPRMFIDPYFYIRGSPECQFWLQNGQSTDILMMQPRNHAVGSIVADQSFISTQMEPVRTSINSLKCMNLRITDENNQPVLLDDDYVLNLTIMFEKCC